MAILFNKKAQKSGGDAWILVLLITLAMIMYILFLPPAERNEFLQDDTLTPGERDDGVLPADLLLQKHIGRLEFYPQGPIDHPLPSVHLFRTTKSEMLSELGSFIVERGTWSGVPVTKQFSIPNTDLVENVILVMNAKSRSGTLKVSLNGQLIAEVSESGGSIPPITLFKEMLKEGNTLTFEVSSPGWRIWRLNQFALDEVRVLADVTDPSKQQALTTLTLSPVEAANLLSSEIRFEASCDAFSVGPLEINVNGKVVYRAIPDCETMNSANVDVTALTSGVNTVTFKSYEGEYRLDSIELTNDLKEVHTFVEYFEVEEDLYKSVLAGADKVFLEIDFVDDAQRKRAQLNVNGHLAAIDQKEPFYARNLNIWLKPGMRNYIELVPESPLNIVEVRVVVR